MGAKPITENTLFYGDNLAEETSTSPQHAINLTEIDLHTGTILHPKISTNTQQSRYQIGSSISLLSTSK